MNVKDNIVYGPPGEALPNISIGQYCINGLREHPYHVVQIDLESGKAYTSKEILDNSVKLASILQSFGVKTGDRVSVATENHPNYYVSICGIFCAGAVFSPLNPSYTEREYRHMLEIFKPRLMFVSHRTEIMMSEIAPTLSWTMKLIEFEDTALTDNVPTLKELLEKDTTTADTFVAPSVADISKELIAIMCSSGTTGVPKGVALSHRSLLYMILNSRKYDYFDIRRDDRLLLFLPLFHSYAFCMLMSALSANSTIYVMRTFKLDTLMKVIDNCKITHAPMVPPVLLALAKSPNLSNYDFSSVRELICGAAPLPRDVGEEVKKRTKVKYIRNGYGMTELAVTATVSDRVLDDDNIGVLLPDLIGKVVDPSTGVVLGPGQVGEICFKGKQIMMGYYGNPEATAEIIDQENWLHTGDLGCYNKTGIFYITGRLKELIKYKGFQVSPSEIEMIIQSHPGVKDAAVIGKPHEINGEVPVAFVVKQPGSTVTVTDILDFTKKSLSPQKWLRGGVHFVDSIPKTPSGKILRMKLQLSTMSKH
ncbi:uncharacterized protein LOC143367722 [Andrena cerasifolii]|uniref:uncharacterized protein LOC143367722 n=1 Tax=Andrena cerasifolii TaxID=2819439 RepID=UPI0040381B39